MTVWVITPYNSDWPERFEEYWQDGKANGYISIGWDIPDPAPMTKKQIAQGLLEIGQYDKNAPSTIFGFYHSIKVNDTIYARHGISRVIGRGNVIRTGYYDPVKCSGLKAALGSDGDLHRHFIDVLWDTDFQAVQLPQRTFFPTTLRECKNEKVLSQVGLSHSGVTLDSIDAVYPSWNERKLVVTHMRIERHGDASRHRKLHDDYTCQACMANFGRLYGPQFRDVVQTHHLAPLSVLLSNADSVKTTLNDLITLCPSCHAMIHKLCGDRNDLDALKVALGKSGRV